MSSAIPEFAGGASHGEVLAAFLKHQAVLIRCAAGSQAAQERAAAAARRLCTAHAAAARGCPFEENERDAREGCWYKSMVVDRHESPCEFAAIEKVVPAHALLEGLRLHDCFWVFFGQNSGASAMRGRPEHVDEVDAMGTMHWQASGCKRWRLRRAPGVSWPASSEPPHNDDVVEVLCEAGSCFLVNTSIYLHQTELPASEQLSISYAREFDLCTLDQPTAVRLGAPHLAMSVPLIWSRIKPTNVERVISVCALCGTATGRMQGGEVDGECKCLCCSMKRNAARALGLALKSRSLSLETRLCKVAAMSALRVERALSRCPCSRRLLSSAALRAFLCALPLLPCEILTNVPCCACGRVPVVVQPSFMESC
jgi:hypothetical protein